MPGRKKPALKDCAHCGSKPRYVGPTDPDLTETCYVICGGCGVQIGLVGDDPVKVWNMRVEAPNSESK